ncbi:2-hydroxyacid dehydrogenase [Ideonella sp.]|uniref:2-hydroxyacid dehydrogenase n=1 Tax=Ideonella sp. TaxID=1929293 RepID=UPI0037C152EC
MKIYLLGSMDAAALSVWQRHLQAEMPEDQVLTSLAPEQKAEVEVAVVANPEPNALLGLPGLRLIQSLWAGVDRLVADPSLPPGVPVCRMVDPQMNVAMAETGQWAVLALHRGFFRYARQQAQACWQPLAQRRADEVRVLVLGWGQMGLALGLRLAAMGYRVSAWRASEEHSGAAEHLGVSVHAGPQALAPALAEVDVLINLLPLTPATRGLLNAPCFAALPQGASVVNLARGAHLVEADLLAALDAGHLSHAVLDVFATEPLPADHPFWQHPAITVLPHAAAQTDPRSAAAVVAANVRALKAGEPLRHVVDVARGY